MTEPPAVAPSRRETAAESLGLNRATLSVLVVVGCLGLSEEVWSNVLGLYLAEQTGAVLGAARYIGIIGFAQNLLEGFGYIIGGTLAHRLGARLALAVSAVPMVVGFTIMLSTRSPWGIAIGALLMMNWEPLSVPATFDIVGSEVPQHRRTTAFAVQSIQKRLPKVIGPALGAATFAAIGFWMNLVVAFGLVALAVVLQLALMPRMRPRAEPEHIPFRAILRQMPRELRLLLTAEILIRWGDWFVRTFAVLYVFDVLTARYGWSAARATITAGTLIAITNLTALATYLPVAKLVDRSPSPRPFIGLTFLLFALFPICLVVLPPLGVWLGLPVIVGLVATFVLNGLREIGEPARKAFIATGFPANVRARGVGLYWGLRSFAFCLSPLVAAYLWARIGPERTFLLGGGIGLVGTAWFALQGNTQLLRRCVISVVVLLLLFFCCC